MLQREIALRPTQIAAFVEPAVALVSAFLFVPAGEIAVPAVLRVAIFVAQDAGGIRVVNDVVAKEQLVLNQVPDQAAEKDNVAAGTDRHPNVGQRAGARKSW